MKGANVVLTQTDAAALALVASVSGSREKEDPLLNVVLSRGSSDERCLEATILRVSTATLKKEGVIAFGST